MGWTTGQGWDAIVVGLGPAGARVVALDGRPSRPKPCGGCLSVRALEHMAVLDPSAWAREHPVGLLWLTAPGRKPHHSCTQTLGAYFVDCERLDAFFRERAHEAGAVVVAGGARGLDRQGGDYAVTTTQGTYQAP